MLPSPAPEPNPYAPPASALADRVAPESLLEPLTTTIAIWLCLGGLNAVFGGLLCFVIIHLIPLNVLWVVVGFGALVTTVIFVDRSLRERGQLDWSRALRSAALIKAALQLTIIPDMILGAVAVGVVNRVLGPGHPWAALPITLLYGGFVAGLVALIAVLVHTSQPPPR